MTVASPANAKKQAMREAGRSDIADAKAHRAFHRGDASGFPVTDKAFLKEMNGFYFS
jgi:hypothetical protein